jgi:hypothetical protein
MWPDIAGGLITANPPLLIARVVIAEWNGQPPRRLGVS